MRDVGTGSSSLLQLSDIKTDKEKYPHYDSLHAFTKVINLNKMVLPLSCCKP